MRVVFEENKQREFLQRILHEQQLTRLDLACILGISPNTLENWLYELNTLPKNIFEELLNRFSPNLDGINLKVIEDSWGQSKGGKSSIQKIIQKYGKEEITRRQRQGGTITGNRNKQKFFVPIIENSAFFEFLGILFGDGWLEQYTYRGRNRHRIGIAFNSNCKSYIQFVKKH